MRPLFRHLQQPPPKHRQRRSLRPPLIEPQQHLSPVLYLCPEQHPALASWLPLLLPPQQPSHLRPHQALQQHPFPPLQRRPLQANQQQPRRPSFRLPHQHDLRSSEDTQEIPDNSRA